jgi:lysophospholipase L1-like esterase
MKLPVRLRPFFALVGYAVISLIIAVVLLEFGAFVVWTAYHWIRPSLQDKMAHTSPAYSGYPWASEFWKEEKSRWKSQHGSYEPFRIWGVAPWNGKYINTDSSPNGTWRRTINPSNNACEKQNVEVWMFGGSTLYGTGVPDWATIPSYLSRDLKSAKTGCVLVRNFGVEGYVTNQELILLMEQLKAGGRPGIVIFYDGVNDSYAGAVSPGVPTAHMSLSNIKARLEGTLAGRLDFLRSSYTLQLATAALNSSHRSSAAGSAVDDTESKVAATLDNYELNLQIATILGKAYGFRVLCFWQPAFVHGHKPLLPFEMTVAGNQAAKNSFNILTKVYQHAQRRAATDHAFVFLGDVFDSVKEPVYIDKWMHLAPLGNELVARSIAEYVEASLDDRPKPSKPPGPPR